jgi:prepilin-type N-terminal cleavage/methylation domain-containing protein
MDDRGHRVADGMTLIELLVSLGVLAVISIAFATILSQSQQVVTRSNALMRANATASAIAQTLRNDLARFCPEGFLALYSDTGGAQHLIFTAVGPFTSLTDPNITANAARIDYGCTASGDLWRRAILLTGTDISGTPWIASDPNDYDQSLWLGRYDPNSPEYRDPALYLNGYCQAPTIPADKQVTAANVNELWPLLARPVTDFNVALWDGTTWRQPTAGNSLSLATAAAVQVRFTLGGIPYEVVCPLRP